MPSSAELQILLTAKNQASKGLGDVNKMVLGLGAAVAGIGVASIHMASDFETAMAQAATLTPAVRDNIGEISDRVLALSQHMGVDATKSATALYEAISAGVPAENAIDFLRIATRSAIAGVTDTATSVKGLTTVLNAYKLPASEAAKVSDIMFQTVNLGVVRFDELNASMSQVIPMASALGVSFTDVGAAVATITKQGTPAAQATTQINAAMVALQRTTPEMDKVLKNLGFTTGTAALQALGFQGTMEALRGEADRLGIPLIELTGRLEGTSAILQLTGKNAAGARSDLEAIRGSAGATDSAFEIMNKTMNRSLESLQASFQVILIEIGSKLLPVITPLVQAFAQWLPAAFETASEAIGPFIAAITSTTTGIGNALALVSGAFELTFGTIAGILDAFQTGEWWRATVAIEEGSDVIAARLRDLAGAVVSTISGLISQLVAALPQIRDQLLEWGRAFIAWVGPAAQRMLGELLVLLSQALKFVGDHAEEIGATLVDWGLKFGEFIVTVALPALLENLPKIAQTIIVWSATEALPAIGQAFFNLGKGIIGRLGEAIGEAWRDVSEAFKYMLQRAVSAIDFWVGPFHISGTSGISFSLPQINIPSFSLPSFQSGGIIPGPIGAPQVVLAHGGEQVLTRGQQSSGGGGITLVFNGDIYGMQDFDAKVRAAIRDAKLAGGFRGVIS